MFLSFTIQCASLDDFLNFWSARYGEKDRKLDRKYYDPYVGKPLTDESRASLFTWKNGTPLSVRKAAGIRKNYPLSTNTEDLEKYLAPNAGGGPIWNIFYMHCINPQHWPIFDQHTFRAMRYLKTGRVEELPKNNQRIYSLYRSEYVPFIQQWGADTRKVDRALHSFGRFLKTIAPAHVEAAR